MKYDSLLPHAGFETMFASQANSPYFLFLILALAAWTLVLKGFSLWYSARSGQHKWFVVMLVLNTLGILEIVYLVWFRNHKKEEVSGILSPKENKGTVAESN